MTTLVIWWNCEEPIVAILFWVIVKDCVHVLSSQSVYSCGFSVIAYFPAYPLKLSLYRKAPLLSLEMKYTINLITNENINICHSNYLKEWVKNDCNTNNQSMYSQIISDGEWNNSCKLESSYRFLYCILICPAIKGWWLQITLTKVIPWYNFVSNGDCVKQ